MATRHIPPPLPPAVPHRRPLTVEELPDSPSLDYDMAPVPSEWATEPLPSLPSRKVRERIEHREEEDALSQNGGDATAALEEEYGPIKQPRSRPRPSPAPRLATPRGERRASARPTSAKASPKAEGWRAKMNPDGTPGAMTRGEKAAYTRHVRGEAEARFKADLAAAKARKLLTPQPAPQPTSLRRDPPSLRNRPTPRPTPKPELRVAPQTTRINAKRHGMIVPPEYPGKPLIIGYWWANNADQRDLPKPQDYVDPTWKGKEKAAVIAYLNAQPVSARYKGMSMCRICGTWNGSTEHSDGTYTWPDGFAHYLEAHAVKPPDQFIQHALGGKKAPTGTYQRVTVERVVKAPSRASVGHPDALRLTVGGKTATVWIGLADGTEVHPDDEARWSTLVADRPKAMRGVVRMASKDVQVFFRQGEVSTVKPPKPGPKPKPPKPGPKPKLPRPIPIKPR